MKPITPAEVGAHKAKVIPGFVFEIFNELITKDYCRGRSIVYQDEVIAKILARYPTEEAGMRRQEIFSSGWLNVEDVYVAAGWQVGYDKPETHRAYYMFSS